MRPGAYLVGHRSAWGACLHAGVGLRQRLDALRRSLCTLRVMQMSGSDSASQQSLALADPIGPFDRPQTRGQCPVTSLDRKQSRVASFNVRVIGRVTCIDVGWLDSGTLRDHRPRLVIVSNLKIGIFQKLHGMQAILSTNM